MDSSISLLRIIKEYNDRIEKYKLKSEDEIILAKTIVRDLYLNKIPTQGQLDNLKKSMLEPINNICIRNI